MKIVGEKYAELSYDELSLSDEDLDNLCELGLILIKNDRKYLIDYTINKLMTETFKVEERDDMLRKLNKKVDFLKSYIKIKI